MCARLGNNPTASQSQACFVCTLPGDIGGGPGGGLMTVPLAPLASKLAQCPSTPDLGVQKQKPDPVGWSPPYTGILNRLPKLSERLKPWAKLQTHSKKLRKRRRNYCPCFSHRYLKLAIRSLSIHIVGRPSGRRQPRRLRPTTPQNFSLVLTKEPWVTILAKLFQQRYAFSRDRS